ncbi:MAG: NF038130 family PEP-CTERM protein [Cyanobacteria bacterium P01_E01_bin.42]
MKGIAQKLLIGTSVLVGTITASAPALAGSLTGANIDPTEPYLIYDTVACGISTSGICTELSNTASAQDVLDNLGNVELSGSTSTSGAADFTNRTTLNGIVDGSAITLSSLNAADWFGAGNTTTSYGDNNFANDWFNDALAASGVNSTLLLAAGYTSTADFFNDFRDSGGFERFSDPNVASVEGDGNGGLEIVLAGHFDATAQLVPFLSPQQQAALAMFAGPIQISEVVKVTYNGVTSFQYGFSATPSGIVEVSDEVSHNGNYTLSQVYNTDEPEGVPEPSTILGLMAIGGLVAASKRKSEKA